MSNLIQRLQQGTMMTDSLGRETFTPAHSNSIEAAAVITALNARILSMEIARDAAGFLGSVEDCIRCFSDIATKTDALVYTLECIANPDWVEMTPDLVRYEARQSLERYSKP